MRWFSLLVFLLLFGCEKTKEQPLKVGLSYEHESHRNRYFSSSLPNRHLIDILNRNTIIVSAELDSQLKTTVEVPVDTSLHIDYKNYKQQYPDIYYEYGSSNPFYVTHNSPDSITITIAVSVNPNYPIEKDQTIDNETTECTENCTVDNASVTDNVTWSDTFFRGVTPTQEQRAKFIAFTDNLTVGTYRKIWIGNTDNVTWCDNETLIDSVISNYDNMTYSFRGQYCGEMYWTFGKCGAGNEISAFPSVIADCACRGVGYTIRPLIGNQNWGGVEGSCTKNQTLDNQTLQIILEKKNE
jgi:hypothetical protein